MEKVIKCVKCGVEFILSPTSYNYDNSFDYYCSPCHQKRMKAISNEFNKKTSKMKIIHECKICKQYCPNGGHEH